MEGIYTLRCWRAGKRGAALAQASTVKEAPDNLRIEAFPSRQRGGNAELLRTVRENPNVLITDPSKELKSFTITLIGTMGTNRLAGRNGLIDSVMEGVVSSYDLIGRPRSVPCRRAAGHRRSGPRTSVMRT